MSRSAVPGRRPRLLRLAALPTLVTLFGCVVQPARFSKDDSPVVLAHQLLTAPDPGQRGSFTVRRLYYGSGNDRNRAEFRDSVTIRTGTVDGSKLAGPPDPTQGKIRKKFWGFDFTRLPINGRVWYPEGDGPFPLVLVVHGNHDMRDFSDPGYGYLGELLASRGFILVSVDENFLNGFMRGENDARGWMLLKHLERWRVWNDSAASPFYHKVDTTNIAVMGHSRGGEAVAVAGLFNRLARYPDDASVTFNFNFQIKSLVAIAPVDGQYRPADKPTPLTDYNYFLIHGSHDGDVSSFSGLTQYERIRFTGDRPLFKSAIFVYRANHGQWNTVWNNKDNGQRSGRALNLAALIPAADQRRFAEVYITAFLEATLRGRSEYLPMFRDHRVAGGWLPKTMYITRFQDSDFHVAADFEEDVDVTSGSVPGIALRGDSMSSWKEASIPFRYRGSTMAHNAVTLGWNSHIAGDDTTRLGPPAAFVMTVSDSLRQAWRVDGDATLEFSLSPTEAKPGPRSPPKDTTKAAADSARKKPKRKPPPKRSAEPDTTPMDLSVEGTDAEGHVARVALSTYGAVRRPLQAYIYRRKGRDKQRFANTYEFVLQTYTIPLRDFERATPGFDASHLTSVRWVFDRTDAGTVLLDNIGFSRLRPAFNLTAAGDAR
jgi:dienelactone hydrolase